MTDYSPRPRGSKLRQNAPDPALAASAAVSRRASGSCRAENERRPMKPIHLPALDPASVVDVVGSGYPEPFRSRMGQRTKKRLGDAAGLTRIGVNLVTLQPGAQSALRHWHTLEDEFVYVLEGELALVTDGG